MLTLDQLRMIDALARHGTVTAAARSLSLTQPAASRLLARTGRAAGVPVVRRTGRAVELTEAGRLLAGHARLVVDRVAAAEADLRRARDGAAPSLRVAAVSTLLATLVPEAVALLDATRRGRVTITHAADAWEAVAAVADGRLDVAVVWVDGDDGAPPAGGTARRLMSEGWAVALPAGHPAAAAPGPVPFAALADATWIVGAHAARLRVLERAAARAGVAVGPPMVQTDQLVMQGLVAAGVGVALLPAGAADAPRPGVVVRALDPAPAPRVVMAVHQDPSAVAADRDALLLALERAGAARG
ncbi:MAG TPA: LysR family transcriptional regulator [Miltoncostaea sp.]|nr:LysR family transcriptional regulator [Miltoncostaea sp.]